MYFGTILRSPLNKWTKNAKHTQKYNGGQRTKTNERTWNNIEKEIKDRERQDRLGDIFSTSLVKDVLYSAGWSLRWGPLEIIITACRFDNYISVKNSLQRVSPLYHPKCGFKIINFWREAEKKTKLRQKKFTKITALYFNLTFTALTRKITRYDFNAAPCY